jgi:Protein of unknown function with HXXEE motif
MGEILATLQRLDFLTALWLFPLAVALHEFEEWNIVRWYEQNFVDLPPLTDKGARAWIVFSSILGFLWTGIAVLPANPTVAAFVLLLAFALMLQNGLQHIYYFYYFRHYAPGVVTSVLLLFPTIGYLAIRAVQQDYVPIWYVILLAIFVIPNLTQTVKAGNTMLSSLRAVHRFGAALAKRF